MKRSIFNKRLLSLIVLTLCLTILSACGITQQLTPEKNTSDPKVYPLTMDDSYIKKATSVPEIIYTTSAEENQLGGSICCLIGEVKEISAAETDVGPLHYFVLKTDLGDVIIENFYDFYLSNYSENSAVFEEPDSDYTFPKVGEYVKVYCVYGGYAKSEDMPYFYYGAPLVILSSYDKNLLETLVNEYNEKSSENDVAKETTKPVKEADGSKGAKPRENLTTGQINALSSAKNYLKFMAFSHSGLVKQLEFEGFAHDDAVYAADNCGADWNQQAAKAAKQYLSVMTFSRSNLIDQLKFDGFTRAQAEYGVSQNGY